jgi:hypothetical protein
MQIADCALCRMSLSLSGPFLPFLESFDQLLARSHHEK